VTDSFKIVSTGLFDSLVSCNGCVSSRSGQIFSFFVGNVLTLRISIALGQTEVNNVDFVLGKFSASNKKVVRLNVSMNDAFFMKFLNSLDKLNRIKRQDLRSKDRLQVENRSSREGPNMSITITWKD